MAIAKDGIASLLYTLNWEIKIYRKDTQVSLHTEDRLDVPEKEASLDQSSATIIQGGLGGPLVSSTSWFINCIGAHEIFIHSFLQLFLHCIDKSLLPHLFRWAAWRRKSSPEMEEASFHV